MKRGRAKPPEHQAVTQESLEANRVEEILQRAREEDRTEQGREERYVFQGTKPASLESSVLRMNKQGIRRSFSTFNIILMIFAAGVGIVLFISNNISVNRLASEVGRLQGRYEELLNQQRMLQAELDQQSSLERIEPIATQLGLQFLPGQSQSIILDEELLERGTSSEPHSP
jgi:cell division protein FtsL